MPWQLPDDFTSDSGYESTDSCRSMPALASASESSFDEFDSDWDLDALIGGSSSEGSADERIRSRSPAPRGVRSTRAVGRRMIAGTPAERRGWLQRAALGPDPLSRSLEKRPDDNGDDGDEPELPIHRPATLHVGRDGTLLF